MQLPEAISVLLHISMWQPRRGSRKAIKRGAEDSKLIHNALHSVEFRRVQALNKKIRRYHADWTWPWQGNFALLPHSRLDDYQEMMQDFIIEYENATKDFSTLVRNIGGAARTDAFPTEQYVLNHNQVTVNFFPADLGLSTVNYLMRLPPGTPELARATTPMVPGPLMESQERIITRNMFMLHQGINERLGAMLAWMSKQAEPEAVSHLIAYSERERHRYLRWCEAIIEFNVLSPMQLDVTQRILQALKDLPGAVDFDETKHSLFFQHIQDLIAMVETIRETIAPTL